MPSLFDLQILARNNPWILAAMWKHRARLPMMQRHVGQRRVVERGDDVLIEGYFRCANTFAVESFRAAQPRPMRIAHHFHSPAQFALARRYGVPAMLLVREPVAAALSYVVFNEGAWSAQRALKNYVDFHRPLLAIPDSFVVAPFDEVTSDFGSTIGRLNTRFGTDFARFDHTSDAQDKVFEGIDKRMSQRGAETGINMEVRMNFPTEERARRKAEIKRVFDDPALDPLKAQARTLYDRLIALA